MAHTGVTHLAGITLIAQVHCAIGKDTAAQTAAEGDNDKILHAMGTAEGMLAKSYHMGIVGHRNGQPQTVAQECCQGDDTLPWQIGCIDDTARLEVGAWTADTHRTDGFVPPVQLHQRNDTLTKGSHKTADIRKLIRGETILSDNVSPDIYYGIGCLLKTDVHSHDAFLNSCLIHYSPSSYSWHKNRNNFDTNQIFHVFFANIYPKVGFFGNIL